MTFKKITSDHQTKKSGMQKAIFPGRRRREGGWLAVNETLIIRRAWGLSGAAIKLGLCGSRGAGEGRVP